MLFCRYITHTRTHTTSTHNPPPLEPPSPSSFSLFLSRVMARKLRTCSRNRLMKTWRADPCEAAGASWVCVRLIALAHQRLLFPLPLTGLDLPNGHVHRELFTFNAAQPRHAGCRCSKLICPLLGMCKTHNLPKLSRSYVSLRPLFAASPSAASSPCANVTAGRQH